MRFFDRLFKAKPKEPAAPIGEVAWAGDALYANKNWPTYNPDDLLSRKGYNIYREMMRDEQVKAVVHFRRNAVTGREWKFEGHEELTEEENAARISLFESIVNQLPGNFKAQLDFVMSSLQFGYSITEKVFKSIEHDGKTWIGLSNLAQKKFDTFYFYFDEYGGVVRFTQKIGAKEQDLDLSKFIHHVHNSDVHPYYGRSELREAYRAWFSKDMAIRFQNIHLERAATGFVTVQPEKGTKITAGTPEHTNLTNVMNNMRSNSAVLFPSGYEVKVNQFGTTDIYEKAVAQNDKAISKALLMPNLLGLSEQGNTGSYSQSQTQLEAFLWMLDAEAKALEETLNEQLFKQLGDLNFGDNKYPWFCFSALSRSQIKEIVTQWKDLVSAGVVNNTPDDEDHVRTMLKFPDRVEEEAIEGETEAQTQPTQQQPDTEPPPVQDETLMGKGQVKTSREAFSRAMKRVDFAVIDNKATTVANAATIKVTNEMKAALESIVAFIKENDLMANPDKVAEVKVTGRNMSRIRKAVEEGLKASWDIGQQHAQKEIEKAQGKRFAADALRLQGDAAQKFLEARAVTVAGDLADSMRKKVVNVLYNGIKNGWEIADIVATIEDEVGSGVLPNIGTAVRTTAFEAINEARYELFASPEVADFVEALEFSAVIDGKTTEVCQHMDGRTYPVGDSVWDTYSPPLHFNCRSILIAVTSRDTWEQSDDPSIPPMDGFGGHA